MSAGDALLSKRGGLLAFKRGCEKGSEREGCDLNKLGERQRNWPALVGGTGSVGVYLNEAIGREERER